MHVLRTPDACFENLKDYPFTPNYCNVQPNLRMHYIDEGQGPTVLLLHGEPSWSYLYRKMIPILTAAGFRVIAPDLIGFGKSDKPSNTEDYTFKRHQEWLTSLLKTLELSEIHMFCQDWGGLLGLRIAATNEALFNTVTVSNTFLPRTGMSANAAFKKWRDFSQHTPHFSAGGVLQMATVSSLDDEVVNAYEAPFPDDSYKAGARIFPVLVPFDGDDPFEELPSCDAAWKVWEQWKKPLLTLFADSDPIMRGGDLFFQRVVPGAKGQPHKIITAAGHFIQEDKGEELANIMVEFITSNLK